MYGFIVQQTYLRPRRYIHKCRGCNCISYVSLPYEWLKFLSLTSGLTYACSSAGKLHIQCPLRAALQELLPPHHQGTDQLQWQWLSQCTQGGLFCLQTQWFCWSHCLQLGSCSFFHIQLAVEWQTLYTQGGECHKFVRLFMHSSSMHWPAPRVLRSLPPAVPTSTVKVYSVVGSRSSISTLESAICMLTLLTAHATRPTCEEGWNVTKYTGNPLAWWRVRGVQLTRALLLLLFTLSTFKLLTWLVGAVRMKEIMQQAEV